MPMGWSLPGRISLGWQLHQRVGAVDAVIDCHVKDGKARFDFSASRLSSFHVLKGAFRLPVHLEQIPSPLRLGALRHNLGASSSLFFFAGIFIGRSAT